MSPLQEALYICAKEGEDFWGTAIVTAQRGGHVILTPECIVIAQRDAPDCLYVWLFVGRGGLAKLCQLAPPEIRWVKWWRGLRFDDANKVRQFSFERVKRLALHETPQSCSAGSPGRSNGNGSSPTGHDSDRRQPVD